MVMLVLDGGVRCVVWWICGGGGVAVTVDGGAGCMAGIM